MLRARISRSWILAIPLAACGAGEDLAAPTTGTLEITVATDGVPTESAEYSLLVDAIAHPVGPSDTLTLAEVSATSHRVELSGVPERCATAGSNRRFVTLTPGVITRLAFQVTCPAPAPGGDLAVSILTAGAAPDTDGYLLVADEAAPIAVAANDTVVLTGLAGGAHTLRVVGLAAQCEVRDANPRTVAVPQSGPTRFDVTCVPPADATVMYVSSPNIAPIFSDIYLRDPRGTAPRNVTNTPEIDEREPVWSPDGRRIAFRTFDADVIFVMDADGNNRRPLVEGLSFARNLQWSPDGGRLLYEDDGRLAIYSFSTGSVLFLTSGSDGFLSGFRWSPDGARVAYSIVDFGPDPDTSAVNTISALGGTPAVVASAVGRHQAVHDWSPDGTTIAYVESQSDDRGDIYLAAANGTGSPANLTNSPGSYDEVVWSPDGVTLAFTNATSSGGDLFSITGAVLRRLTRESGSYRNLDWSPDGSRLLYEEGFEIYYINFDGTGRRAVTATANEFLSDEASWRP